MAKLDELLSRIPGGERRGVYLLLGDLVTAEPAAIRMGEALGEAVGAPPVVRRRPEALGEILADLRTYSLFGGGKVVVVIGSALLADRAVAALLVDEALEAAPPGGEELAPRERAGASRLLQVLRLFDLDPERGAPEELLARLPDWVLQGAARRARAKSKVAAARDDLALLLAAARRAGVAGHAEGDLAAVSTLVGEGLPEGHHLVLAESAAADGHPLVARLDAEGAVVRTGSVGADRRGSWQGLSGLADELARQTGTRIAPDALDELARRTLRLEDRSQDVAGDSTARLAAEYRKLAEMSQGRRIERDLVERTVVDRGQEDVWKVLDAVGEGRIDRALGGLHRLLAVSSDPVRARLSFFALLADFCRQVAAVASLLDLLELPRNERSYPRFKARLAPALGRDLPAGGASPVAGLHPFRLHRAYLAASRLSPRRLAVLPWEVLRTELALKGESDEPETALDALVLAFGR